MELLPIRTRRIESNDDLIPLISRGIQESDIIVISSKAAATAEGNVIDLSTLTPSKEADYFAERCGRSPAFCEAVLQEVKKRNGRVRGTCPGAILTELKPWGASTLPLSRHAERSELEERAKSKHVAGYFQYDSMGTIFTANAGLDESNVPKNTAIGWPEDPVQSVRMLRKVFQEQMRDKGNGTREMGPLPSPFSPLPNIAVIISDSCVRPRRWGVTAYALAVAGFDPLKDEAGREDLYQRKLRITKEAVADQLATAANMLMGNADQAIPAVIIRDHGIPFSDFVGWVPGIEPAEDLFQGMI